MRTLLGVCVCLALPVLAGCGSGGLNDISGTVTFRGKPASDFMVNFVPVQGRPGKAITDQAGRYADVTADRGRHGLPAGEYDVVLKWVAPDEQITPQNPHPAPPPEWEPLETKYGNFAAPAKKVKIEDGQRTLNIDLD